MGVSSRCQAGVTHGLRACGIRRLDWSDVDWPNVPPSMWPCRSPVTTMVDLRWL